ncbi:MAG TPA: S4 domain-containing protein, partial [Blastocatellia bacterium]|nr:S4 domain-containing protein [Blastocatellia bacterium]
PNEVDALRQACGGGERHPREVKAELARRIVTDFHSPEEAAHASDEFDRIFAERQLPAEIPGVERAAATYKIVKLLAAEGLAPSVAEAQRLVAAGSVRLDGERVTDVKFEIACDRGRQLLVQVGKRKFLRVTFN